VFYGRAVRFLLVAALFGAALAGVLVMGAVGITKIPDMMQHNVAVLAREGPVHIVVMVAGLGMLIIFTVVFAPIIALPLTLAFASMATLWIVARGRCSAWVVVLSAGVPTIALVLYHALQGYAPMWDNIEGLLVVSTLAAIAGLACRALTIRLGYMPR
jgi:hypothetical protein